jgi:hypothetical protein
MVGAKDKCMPSPDFILNAPAWFALSSDPTLLNITINTGDQIRLTSIAGNNTGTSIVENLTTSQRVNQTSNSTDQLCPTSAAWILEPYLQPNSSVPFADFGGVFFFGDVAASSGSSRYSGLGAALYDISLNGKMVTSTSKTETSIDISYVWT